MSKQYFNSYVNRVGTRSIKWDGYAERFGLDSKFELLPMWVADMDFKCPQKVIDAIVSKAQEGVYGYAMKPDSFFDSIISWVSRRYFFETCKEEIIFSPGVVPGLNVAIQAFTEPGEGVIIQPPVYYPFKDGIKNNNRCLVENPLTVDEDGMYTIDFCDLENKAKDPNNKLLILCNPHNPVGRCWTKEELTELGNICVKHGVIVVADEIHADLIMKGYSHTAFSSLSEEIKNNCVSFYAPSKTFNTAGLQTSFCIISNKNLRDMFSMQITRNRIVNMNWFGPVALETAYNECEDYVSDLCEFLTDNKEYMNDYIKEKLPMLKVSELEGTYLPWVDFRGTGMTPQQIEEYIIYKAKVGADLGSWFGTGGEGFLRFNIACSRSTLEEALERIRKTINT